MGFKTRGVHVAECFKPSKMFMVDPKTFMVDLLISRMITGFINYTSGETQLQNVAVSLSDLKRLIKHSFFFVFFMN